MAQVEGASKRKEGKRGNIKARPRPRKSSFFNSMIRKSIGGPEGVKKGPQQKGKKLPRSKLTAALRGLLQ